jgi:SAM-dependent methyltransferase
MHQNSKFLFENYAKKYFGPGMRVLEIGPDKFPSSYQAIIGLKVTEWHTLDLSENPNLTYVTVDEYSFPIPDSAYDIVLSGQVLEHVRKPWIWIKEVARVCRREGLVITINPVSWPYHEAPVDCWRAYPEGMKALYEDAGLEVIVSAVDSFEVPTYRRYIPGRSPEWQGWRWRVANQFLGKLGFPVERAYDTITIGKKTPHRASEATAPVSAG